MYSPICGNIISGDIPENVVIISGSTMFGTFCDDSKRNSPLVLSDMLFAVMLLLLEELLN